MERALYCLDSSRAAVAVVRIFGTTEVESSRGAVAWAARQRAVSFLAPVYGWFTQRFDTADLKDVKTLLEQMS